ncbi:MAG TPA: alpha/beta hydrolase, partial [Chthoniobacteraceae bacterium]|nr:alpha/beta hydrolase [Chthoniobacteraceae bacterium]
MPVVTSSFRPPLLLSNRHVQTVLPALFPQKLPFVFKRERLELDDGDFLDLYWSRLRPEPAGSLVILSHGLEGSAGNGYMLGMARAFNAGGWDALAWDFRGCGIELNRLLRFYHSGETRDLATIIRYVAAQYARIALVGFSLGGN